MNSPPPEPPTPKHGKKLLAGMAVVMLVPVCLVVFVFPLLAKPGFDDVSQLTPTEISRLEVVIRNRQGIDDGPDIGPYVADPADYAAILDALRNVPKVPDFDGARGPILGEFQVLPKNGRKGTIRLYWQQPAAGPEAGPPRLRFQIGPAKFEGGSVAGLIDAVAKGAERGK